MPPPEPGPFEGGPILANGSPHTGILTLGSLMSSGLRDLELPINISGERVAFKVSTSAPGNWFRLQKFTPSLRVDPWAPVRGFN